MRPLLVGGERRRGLPFKAVCIVKPNTEILRNDWVLVLVLVLCCM